MSGHDYGLFYLGIHFLAILPFCTFITILLILKKKLSLDKYNKQFIKLLYKWKMSGNIYI